MIGWGDVYNVVVAVVPLYVALLLGYASVKWWRIFRTAEQCDAVTRFVSYFTLPLFTFEFTVHVDPYEMNYKFAAADAISKAIIVAVLAVWARFCTKGSFCWSITGFSLSTLTNGLVVGVPLIKAMYGPRAVDLVVQSSVIQAVVWLTLLLFVLELRQTKNNFNSAGEAAAVQNGGEDLEGNNRKAAAAVVESSDRAAPSFWRTSMKAVWYKMAMNPNTYGCFGGIIWAFISKRWHFEMPILMEGSILILSKAGTGTAMFSMGLFMALQEKVVACGAGVTAIGMALKFIAGPAAMAVASIAVGLRGDILRVAIIQAALPQSITSFIFAVEYGLHANVLSTAVILGMIVSLPVLVGYYAILEFVQ
ncbi:PREDICTED: auxin efflux carrier component 5-like [Ipomoea nil]|uniref:auxin efflux carrier component 5-like n=1 Tax=Ipomoea nil TaxID=35883 RepID=UPI0009011B1F|nr:PREDICTED: auxin efflux carrier component 5-like [Ipomoea nil]